MFTFNLSGVPVAKLEERCISITGCGFNSHMLQKLSASSECINVYVILLEVMSVFPISLTLTARSSRLKYVNSRHPTRITWVATGQLNRPGVFIRSLSMGLLFMGEMIMKLKWGVRRITWGGGGGAGGSVAWFQLYSFNYSHTWSRATNLTHFNPSLGYPVSPPLYPQQTIRPEPPTLPPPHTHSSLPFPLWICYYAKRWCNIPDPSP